MYQNNCKMLEALLTASPLDQVIGVSLQHVMASGEFCLPQLTEVEMQHSRAACDCERSRDVEDFKLVPVNAVERCYVFLFANLERQITQHVKEYMYMY